jgi:Mrp family chromosome partitioning ATPase
MERLKRAMEKARASATASASAPESRADAQFNRAEIATAVPSDVKVLHVDRDSLKQHRIIAGDKEDPRTAAFDRLRTQVLREMRNKGYRRLGVTSPTPGCGKTTVAINLALSLAQLTEPRVVLGDLDFRRPKISEFLGIRPDTDLSDFVLEGVPLTDVLVDPGIAGLLLLPNTRPQRNAAEVLTSPRMKSLMTALISEDQSLLCIFDLPPLLPTDDTIAFLPQVDCLLMIVADGSTRKPELEESLRLVTGTPLLGVVLNKSDAEPSSYY